MSHTHTHNIISSCLLKNTYGGGLKEGSLEVQTSNRDALVLGV